MTDKNAKKYLPLTEATYYIMLSLVEPLHGYGVMQRVKEISKPIYYYYNGDRKGIRTMQKSNELSNKNVDAIAPNFIHSLDACHLQNTVNTCSDKGIRDFMMIHDSFGTHAGNCKELADTLRSEFINIYLENDVLQNFIDEQDWFLTEQLKEKNIKIPNNGYLNLRSISDNEYFFS